MSQHQVFEALISALATEVASRLPKPEEVTADQFKSSIETMLVEAEWFKAMVKEYTEAVITVNGPDIETETQAYAQKWLENNFDISDYRSDIESVVEDAIGDVDFGDKIEEALDDANIEQKVEHEVEEQVAPLIDSVDKIKTRVEAMEKWIKAVQNATLEA